MREEGWGQPPKVFSAWWGVSQPSLAAHRSQLKEPGGAPTSWTWGRGDVGTGANNPSFPIPSSNGDGGSQAPSIAAPSPPHIR